MLVVVVLGTHRILLLSVARCLELFSYALFEVVLVLRCIEHAFEKWILRERRERVLQSKFARRITISRQTLR